MFTNVIRPGSLWRSAERLSFLLVQETTALQSDHFDDPVIYGSPF
jgi:hypothetical protein